MSTDMNGRAGARQRRTRPTHHTERPGWGLQMERSSGGSLREYCRANFLFAIRRRS